MKEFSYRHFQNNFILYLVVVICLLVGISAGAITINVLSYNQKKELISFLDSFFKVLNENNIDSLVLLKQSLVNNLQTIASIWLLGLTVIGIPIIMAVVILRGFVIGFTVGLLFEELGFKGLIFSTFAMLPQNLFIIPGIIIISVTSISFSVMIVKNKMRRIRRNNYFKELLLYSTTILLLSIILIVGSIIEAYVSPVFMKLLSRYISSVSGGAYLV